VLLIEQFKESNPVRDGRMVHLHSSSLYSTNFFFCNWWISSPCLP